MKTQSTATGCDFVYESNQKIVEVYSPQDRSEWYSGPVNQYGAESHGRHFRMLTPIR